RKPLAIDDSEAPGSVTSPDTDDRAEHNSRSALHNSPNRSDVRPWPRLLLLHLNLGCSRCLRHENSLVELVFQLRNMSDDSDHASADLKTANGVGDDAQGFRVEGSEAFIDEQTVELDRTGCLLNLGAEFESEGERGQEGLAAGKCVGAAR